MHLSLAERYLLLATDPESGRTHAYSLPQGLAAALLSELSLCDRVGIESGRVHVLSVETTGCDLLDVALQLLASFEPGITVESAVPALTGMHELGRRVADRLVERGFMVNRGHHALGIIPYHRHEITDQTAWAEMDQRVRGAILHPEAANPEDRALAAILAVAGPAPHGLKQQAAALADTDPVASGLRRAIENEAAAAAMISAMC